MTREQVWQAIVDERRRQDVKHPEWLGDVIALPILVEEVGEVAKAMIDLDGESLTEEIGYATFRVKTQ